jgi:hypothetical protein
MFPSNEDEQTRLMDTRDVFECANHFPVTSVKLLADGTDQLRAVATHCPGGVRTTTNADLTTYCGECLCCARRTPGARSLTTSSRAVLEQCSTLLGENSLLLRKNEEIERDNKRLKAQSLSLSLPLSPCHNGIADLKGLGLF